MAQSHVASQTIAEMREFATFEAKEQFFICRSLDIALDRSAAFSLGSEISAHCSASWSQYVAYREMRELRGGFTRDMPLDALDTFFSVLVRVAAHDLARGQIESFSAFRFLYERLLGAAVRPYLPAAFCAAAALPQIVPSSRKALLESLSEAMVMTPAWSPREPVFFPATLAEEAA